MMRPPFQAPRYTKDSPRRRFVRQRGLSAIYEEILRLSA